MLNFPLRVDNMARNNNDGGGWMRMQDYRVLIRAGYRSTGHLADDDDSLKLSWKIGIEIK